jgi:hypothetical protein
LAAGFQADRLISNDLHKAVMIEAAAAHKYVMNLSKDCDIQIDGSSSRGL